MRRVVCCLLLLAACSPSEEDFPAALAEAECAVLVDCFAAAWPTFEACVNERTSGAAEGTYDADAAASCLDEVSELTCPDSDDPPAWPASCDAVWSR